MSASFQPFALAVTIDRDSPIPLHEQISGPLEELIQAGKLSPGQLIEDEVSMAKRLEVSRPTTRRALQELVNRGLLSRRRGIGTHVTPKHVRRPLSLTSLQDDLTKAGFTPTTRVLRYEVRLSNAEDCAHLQVEEGTEIVAITRLRMADGQPLALLHNLIPAQFAPSITQLNSGGLYAAFAEAGMHPVAAQQTISARLSDDFEAENLHLPVPSPVLTMQRTALDEHGQVLEYGDHVYNPENYSFHSLLTTG